jgi:hypothetical protein
MPDNIYWERQRGDNCRIHSINAFFGKEMVTEQEFYKYCEEYDQIIPGLKSRNMDGFAEARCIISYILSKIGGSHTVLIPINKYTGARNNLDLARYDKMINNLEITSYFEFNPGHVWLNKYIPDKKQWFKIDSISGINPIDPRINFNGNGMILVINHKPVLGFELIHYIKNLTGDKEKDEIMLYNLYHSVKIFINMDPSSELIHRTAIKSMIFFLDNYIRGRRHIISINNENKGIN